MNRCCTEFFETLSGTGLLASICLAAHVVVTIRPSCFVERLMNMTGA